MESEELTREIIGASYTVYNRMGFGYLESVYEKCLAIEFKHRGIDAQFQYPIVVYYGNHAVGEFAADILVANNVIVELKSVTRIIKAHEIQLVNYLVATRIPVGLIINFAPTKVDIKRKVPSLQHQYP